jgi:hypothetical protein
MKGVSGKDAQVRGVFRLNKEKKTGKKETIAGF